MVMIFLILAWMLPILVLWQLSSFAIAVVSQARQMHRIPCAGCAFCTGDYRLKCTVQPFTALTEAAIGCTDFRSRTATGLVEHP
jgi:hypothetical protein